MRVNCVAPGVIDTAMMAEHSEETKAALAEDTPLSRLGRPEEVATAVSFLTDALAGALRGVERPETAREERLREKYEIAD